MVAIYARPPRHRVLGALHPYTFRGSRSVPVTGLGSRPLGRYGKDRRIYTAPLGGEPTTTHALPGELCHACAPLR